MDTRNQVTKWVEEKFGNVITKDLKEKIQKEDSLFEIEPYAENLFDIIFKEKNAERIKNEILSNHREYNLSRSDSGLSKEDICRSNSLDSLVFEHNDFANFSTTELVKDLKSSNEDTRFKSLKCLEVIAEDLINQTSWQTIRKVLQILLQQKVNRNHQLLILKIFLKFMMCINKPQMVSESFVTIAEVVSYHIEILNISEEKILLEETYDFKEDKWLNKKISSEFKTNSNCFGKSQQPLDNEVLIKSMWLLIECQKQMPEKWIRFNERKLKEIVFSFVYLLASTSTPEMEKLSGLELISTLNPSGSWCRHWCHTALGRALLCSAFRKYKNFFIRMVEIVLTRIRDLRNKLQPIIKEAKENSKSNAPPNENTKCINSSKGERLKLNSAPEIKSEIPFSEVKNFKLIPEKIIKQATFCHCMSVLVFLIQFRSGRALFPVQTSLKRRSLTVQDFAQSVMNFLENLDYETTEVNLTREGKQLFTELLNLLKNFSLNIKSSRSAEKSLSALTYSSFK